MAITKVKQSLARANLGQVTEGGVSQLRATLDRMSHANVGYLP